MDSYRVKEVLVDLFETVCGVNRDVIVMNTDVESLVVGRIVNKLTFSPDIDVLDVSLKDGTKFSIFGDDFRENLYSEDPDGATEFVKKELNHAKERPFCLLGAKDAGNSHQCSHT